MSTFNESFHTTDFDQEMMDFIESKYKVSDIQWVLDSAELVYGESNNYFWTNDTGRGDSSCTQYRSYYKELTKQQFKEKIGMPVDNNTKEETFTKKDLVDGMFVKFSDENQYRLVLAGNLHGKDGFCPLASFTEDLLFGHGEGDSYDITEVFQSDGCYTLKANQEQGVGLLSIWKRTPPKSEKVIKLEQLISMHEEQLEATKKLLAEELNNV